MRMLHYITERLAERAAKKHAAEHDAYLRQLRANLNEWFDLDPLPHLTPEPEQKNERRSTAKN